jgi:hypothetical protein
MSSKAERLSLFSYADNNYFGTQCSFNSRQLEANSEHSTPGARAFDGLSARILRATIRPGGSRSG